MRIAVSAGDPAGIGPEIVLKALGNLNAEITVITASGVFERLADKFGWDISAVMKRVHSIGDLPLPALGMPSRAGGEIAFRSVVEGIRLCLNGECDALVTAPISKEAWALAGHHYPGHTELLGEMAGVSDFSMCFAALPYLIVLATTHIPLKDVPHTITAELVLKKIRDARVLVGMTKGGGESVWVLGLNPHAGEDGLFGTEEREIVKAVALAKDEGIAAEGPLVPDAFFRKWVEEPVGAVVALYHDQGLIPFKMLSHGRGVNITLGLPFVRTSPDHGTAFDIASQGIADPSSMKAAIEMAIKMCSSSGHSPMSRPARRMVHSLRPY